MDEQIIKRFKRFQQATGQFLDLEIEEVEFEPIAFKNKEVFKFVKGQNKYIRRYVDANAGDTPVLGSSLNNECIYSKIKPISSKDIIVEESVSFNKDNAKGSRAFYRNYPYVMDRHHLAIVPDKTIVYPQYLQKYLDSFLRSKNYGWGAHVASEKEIKQYKLPVPKPLNDKYGSFELQKAILLFIEYYENDNKEKLDTIIKIGELAEKMENLVVPLFFQKDNSAAKRFNQFCTEIGVNLRLSEIKFEKELFFKNDKFAKTSQLGLKHTQIPKNIECDEDIKLYPVFSASSNPIAYLPESFNTNKLIKIELDNPDISFATDGDASAGTNFIIHDNNYFINNTRFVIRFKEKEIYYSQYIFYCIRDMKIRYGYNRKKKANLSTIKNEIEINIPKTDENNFSSYQLQQISSSFFKDYSKSLKKIKNTVEELKVLLPKHTQILIHKTFNT